MSDQPDEPPPWSAEHRHLMRIRINDAAARAREALGAHDVLMVAWFQDIAQPQFLHCQDGGTAPMPPREVYRYMAKIMDTFEQRVAEGETVLELSGDETGSSTVQ